MKSQDTRTILLVEDNDDDAFITERAFKTAGVSISMTRCRDGQSVLDYLEGKGLYGDREKYPFPTLVLLDFKIPQKSGLEILRWVRQHKIFSSLVVIALTSSSERVDVTEAYKLHINAYLVKPSSLSTMTELARAIGTFWLNKVTFVYPLFAPSLLAGSHFI